MKIAYLILAVLSLFSVSAFSQEDHWEVYLAQYEKGAGSTLVNMSLKDEDSMRQYPYLLKVGVKLLQCSAEGLPTEEEFKTLHAIGDKVKAGMDWLGKNMQAGTFSYQCKRTDYYYIRDTTYSRKYLAATFKKYFPQYEYFIEIQADTNWDAYLTFLYPNEETMEYIENEKVIMNLTKAGDDLSKPRQVDHWLYFKTEAGRGSFLEYALQEKYKVESKEFIEKSALHYQLHLSRTDKVDIASISAVTIQLRKKAKEFNGDYDGWETFVIK